MDRVLDNRWRAARWASVGIALLVPLVAMRFTDEVVWTLGDFAAAGVLLGGAVATYEVGLRLPRNLTYRAGLGLLVLSTLFLVWMNLAVGLLGTDPANVLYAAVVAVAAAGSFGCRMAPAGLARTSGAMAIVQASIAALAVPMQWGSPFEIVVGNGAFVGCFAIAAWLFARAAKDG